MVKRSSKLQAPSSKIKCVEIGGRNIGPGEPCFVIAEAGVNHNGQVALAKQLIDVAVEAKADAVKFQTFRADRVASPVAAKAAYQQQTTGGTESQVEMIRRLELPPEAFDELNAYGRTRGILFLSSPFDEESVEVLTDLGVPAFKIASGEITNTPLLERVARTRKPVILSTGMSTLEEVKTAVEVLRRAGTTQLILLHCVSNYPADPAHANLRAMATLRETFGVPVGFSDHTLGLDVAIAAVALGASVIEKHLTLDRSGPGPDHHASLEAGAFAALVRGIRHVEAALGDGSKRPVASEHNVAAVARKSLVADRDIPAGTRITKACVAIKRPGTGLPPSLQTQLVGKVANVDIATGTLFSWDLVT